MGRPYPRLYTRGIHRANILAVYIAGILAGHRLSLARPIQTSITRRKPARKRGWRPSLPSRLSRASRCRPLHRRMPGELRPVEPNAQSALSSQAARAFDPLRPRGSGGGRDRDEPQSSFLRSARLGGCLVPGSVPGFVPSRFIEGRRGRRVLPPPSPGGRRRISLARRFCG